MRLSITNYSIPLLIAPVWRYTAGIRRTKPVWILKNILHFYCGGVVCHVSAVYAWSAHIDVTFAERNNDA